MYSSQQWSCDACTYKQPATSMRCAMCANPNPFMVGSNQSATYFKPQQPPPKPKPVVKEKLRHLSKPRKNGEFGKIVYQTDRISKSQVLDTYAIYLLNKDIKTSSWPLYVFGENDIDKIRAKGSEREMIGGLAGVLGDYDTSVSFGITTTFYKNKSVNKDFNAFKKIIDDDFDVLLKYVKNGHDIIVPSPNLQDLHGFYEKSYWKMVGNEKKQVIFHNIGTGLAGIPFNFIEYIQTKFDRLKEVGDKNSLDVMSKANVDQIQDDKKEVDDKDKDKNVEDGKDKKKDEQNVNVEQAKVVKEAEKPKESGASNTNVVPMDIDGDAELARAIAASLQNK